MTENIPDPEQEAEQHWLAAEREKVLQYLEIEGCQHAGLAEWPTFSVVPHLALWAVQSTKHEGRIGWWAISGDVPTDYMSSSDGEQPQDALRHFSSQWRDVAGYLNRGEEHPTMDLGEPEDWPELAAVLEERAAALEQFAEELDEES